MDLRSYERTPEHAGVPPITTAEVKYQAFYLVVKVVLVLFIGTVIDKLFLQRTFTPAHWGTPLAYLVWKASSETGLNRAYRLGPLMTARWRPSGSSSRTARR
jgi:hypothetical protein